MKIVVPNRPLKVIEVAKLVGVSVRTVWREISRGALEVQHVARKCTRVLPGALAAWIVSCDPRAEVEVECRPS